MNLWFAHRAAEKLKKLKNKTRCHRCGLYYEKHLRACSHCSALDDLQLDAIIRKRRSFRTKLGIGMFIGAVVFFGLILLGAIGLR